jgi:hypothetical protein
MSPRLTVLLTHVQRHEKRLQIKRSDVLFRDADRSQPFTVPTSGTCTHEMTSGTWRGAYTGRLLAFTNLRDPHQVRHHRDALPVRRRHLREDRAPPDARHLRRPLLTQSSPRPALGIAAAVVAHQNSSGGASSSGPLLRTLFTAFMIA